jgi:heat-inducible transcriptional repressor
MNMLTPRRIQIFKAVVEEYVRTAEPVGSSTLRERYKLPYSSSTIRNDMQVLEEMGYLEKTHTSSGRVPSTQGYKFYVENLLDESSVDHKMEMAIREAFDVSNMNIEDAVHKSCEILSEMTNMTAGAIGPDSSTQRLEHIKVFPIDSRNLVAVFITNLGHTETRNFHFDEDVSVKDIESTVDVLNERLKGVAVTDLPEQMEELRPELEQIVQKHDVLFAAFVKAFIKFASENVYFSGKDRMLYQPEFEDITKLKELMRVLDDPSSWRQISNSENAASITTTSGAQLTWVDDVAVVRSTFRINQGETGQLMVVGPSRMNYDRVVSMLEYISKLIEKIYSSGGEKG